VNEASPQDLELRRTVLALDKQYLWHPYTEMGGWIEHSQPLVIKRGEGSRLYDFDGRVLIDGNASWWTSLLGHNHPRLVAALSRQASDLCHCSLAGITHEPAARLAAELVATTPTELTRVFFSDDGSTAVEVAVKLAVQYWRQMGEPNRYRFVALDGAFHGETLAPTALGGVPEFRAPFERIVMDVIHVSPTSSGYDEAFSQLHDLLTAQAPSIAAVVVEPVLQGCAGMRIYPAEYLAALRRLTKQLGILLVADEVFTGYGRTGPFWGCEHAGVVPDILCTAKGFSGGILPMAATLVTDDLFNAFIGDKSRAFYYGHTFCGNPLGAAVAREVLAIYRDERILERAKPKSQKIASTFEAFSERPYVVDSRSLGMMGALELAGPSSYFGDLGWRVYEQALRRGAYVRPLGNVVYITPALNIPDSDLDELLCIIGESLDAAFSQ
jgi:adenosylmethionine---8-amino-7-oxononanoate aminotransferase